MSRECVKGNISSEKPATGLCQIKLQLNDIEYCCIRLDSKFGNNIFFFLFRITVKPFSVRVVDRLFWTGIFWR